MFSSSQIGEEQETSQFRIPRIKKVSLVCNDISDEITRKDIACEIEKAFRAEGFEFPVIEAALLNAYAESGFDPKAIGDNGKSKGIFQLKSDGLGYKMQDSERFSVKSSVRRVAVAIRQSSKFGKAIKRGAETRELTALFCTEIMRPSDKFENARKRKGLESFVFKSSASKRRQS